MVPFAGWEMPVLYPSAGVLKEHNQCRTESALFDVSHMVQLKLHGKDRVAFLEKLVVGDIAGLAQGFSRLSVFTNEKGGIIDDTVITNAGDHLYVVVNAGCAEKDIAHLNQHMKEFKSKGGDVNLEIFSEQNALIAVQGPKTEEIMKRLVKDGDITTMDFMTQRHLTVNGVPCIVTRCGYTGEDGFEISVPTNRAVALSSALVKEGVHPAGLGARDSLRLEAGLCLYGHDIDAETSPIEAGLGWLINKKRKEQGGFLGHETIMKHVKEGVQKKRVGFTVTGAPAREGATIHNEKGDQIGTITSGTVGPTAKKNVAMGYISTEFSKTDTPVVIKVRGRDQHAVVAKMPFVETHYKKPADKK